jgi:hypothetical protein
MIYYGVNNMINILILKKNIEKLREKLYFLLSVKEPTDTSVVKCSQELDKLIVEYEYMKQYCLDRKIEVNFCCGNALRIS